MRTLARLVIAVSVCVSCWRAPVFGFDEHPDVVATDLDSLQVFRGDGAGALQAPRQLFIQESCEPWHLVTGDVNGDGVVDLVSANRFGPHVTIHLGKGDATYEEPRFVFTSELPYDVDLGDLDRDGDLDLVVTCNNDAGPLEVRRNDGAGFFDEVTRIFAGAGQQEFFNSELGDFDEDGWLDLALTLSDTDNVAIYLNDRRGGLILARLVPSGDDPKPLRAGRVDGDAHLDLVVGHEGNGTVVVLLGDGRGAFTRRGAYQAGPQPRELVLADFDGDSRDDVAVVGGRGADSITRFLSAADGALGAALTLATGPRPNSIAAADFDGDGATDLAVANWSLDNEPLASLSLLLGDGAGGFPSERDYVPDGGFRKITAVAVGQLDAFRFRRGDVNLDGRLSVADPIHIFQSIFNRWLLPCADAADLDDDGAVEIEDAFGLFGHVFFNNRPPAPPFPAAAMDPTRDRLSCDPPASSGGPSVRRR